MNTWKEIIEAEYQKPYFKNLKLKLAEEYKNHTVYPPKEEIYTAFKFCPLEKTKVFLLGQDPYHSPNQAHGLAFSVKPGTPIPPSLRNIYKELESDLGIKPPSHGDLTSWTNQGILLLNSCLTVRQGVANSHANLGWHTFTDNIISHLNNHDSPIIFILWGGFAKKKLNLITNPKHFIISSAHPSPLSAYNGFFNSKPFSQVNKILTDNNQSPINWDLKENQ